MQNVTVIQAFAYSDVIKRVVELTKQGYEVDYSARVYPRFVGNKYVVTMCLPEQKPVEDAVEDVVVVQDTQPQESGHEKKHTRAKKKTADGGGEND